MPGSINQTATDGLFIHVTPRAGACQHEFKGWREFDDGRGGERVCTKCGMGAMAWTLANDPT